MGLDSVIYQKVRELDAKKQEQILNYIELITKKETMNHDESSFQAFSFGILADSNINMCSVDLQHTILNWRFRDVSS